MFVAWGTFVDIGVRICWSGDGWRGLNGLGGENEVVDNRFRSCV